MLRGPRSVRWRTVACWSAGSRQPAGGTCATEGAHSSGALSVATRTLDDAASTVLSAEERVIYMAAVEAKGATTVGKEPFPAADLPAGAGYVRRAPDPASGRWEVSVYQWSPATAIVRQGDHPRLIGRTDLA